jgi:hypothetical protein
MCGIAFLTSLFFWNIVVAKSPIELYEKEK